MLELRLSCENCDKALPNDCDYPMICTYECTFCKNCVDSILKNVCPSCGGGFEKRPTRPKGQLGKNPARKDKVLKPVTDNPYLSQNINIDPRER